MSKERRIDLTDPNNWKRSNADAIATTLGFEYSDVFPEILLRFIVEVVAPATCHRHLAILAITFFNREGAKSSIRSRRKRYPYKGNRPSINRA